MSRLIDQLDSRPSSELIYSYAPSGKKLKSFFNSWNVCNIIEGPVGSSKTTDLCFKLFEAISDMAKSPDGVRRSRWAVVRNTNADLKRTIMKEWLELFEDCGVYNISDKEHHIRFTNAEDGSQVEALIYFMALETEKSVKALLSMQLTGIIYNEIREQIHKIVFRSLQRVARFPSQGNMPLVPVGDPKYLSYWCPKKHNQWMSLPKNVRQQTPYPNRRYWSGLMADSNAWDRDHWLETVRRQDFPSWSFHHQEGGVIKVNGEWQVNPNAENLENLSPDYYPDALAGASENEIRVQLANERTVTINGEPVHPDFEYNRHVCHTAGYTPGIQAYGGLDFARRPAAVLAQPVHGGYHVFGEFPMFNVGLDRYFTELSVYLMTKFSLRPSDIKWVGDESSNTRNESDESAVMIAAKHGYQVSDPLVGNKDHAGRRNTIDQHLHKTRPKDGRPAFLVHPDCNWFIGAMEGKWFYAKVYSQKEDRFMAQPFKNDHSHTGDAGEYCMSQFGVGITRKRSTFRSTVPAMS